MIVLFFYLNVFPFYKNRNLGRMFLGLRIEFLFFVVRIIIVIVRNLVDFWILKFSIKKKRNTLEMV